MGWVHPSCVHQVPSGALIDEKDDVIVDGKVVAVYPPCPYRLIESAEGSSHGPGYSGWVLDTSQQAPSGEFFDDVFSTIQVPPAPGDQTGGTLGYFQGLNSSATNQAGGGCGILQPVLHWGPGPDGGGQFWAFSSYWWSVGGGNNGFFTAAIRTSAGNQLWSRMIINSNGFVVGDARFHLGK
jgi:hypothetical protein